MPFGANKLRLYPLYQFTHLLLLMMYFSDHQDVYGSSLSFLATVMAAGISAAGDTSAGSAVSASGSADALSPTTIRHSGLKRQRLRLLELAHLSAQGYPVVVQLSCFYPTNLQTSLEALQACR